jgi:hypothetical protein
LTPKTAALNYSGGKVFFKLNVQALPGSTCKEVLLDQSSGQSYPGDAIACSSGTWNGGITWTIPARSSDDTLTLTVTVSGPGENTATATSTITVTENG